MQTITSHGGKTTAIHARIEPKLKKDVERIFGEVGLSMSDAINLFLKQVRLHEGLPFEVKIPNKTTVKALEDSRNRRNLKKYSGSSELFD